MVSIVLTAVAAGRRIPDTPVLDNLTGCLLLIAGVLLYVYRRRIGEFTGYYVGRGKWVDKPSPGCLLIPFAFALIAGGSLILFRSILALFVSK